MSEVSKLFALLAQLSNEKLEGQLALTPHERYLPILHKGMDILALTAEFYKRPHLLVDEYASEVGVGTARRG